MATYTQATKNKKKGVENGKARDQGMQGMSWNREDNNQEWETGLREYADVL